MFGGWSMVKAAGVWPCFGDEEGRRAVGVGRVLKHLGEVEIALGHGRALASSGESA